MAIFHGKKGTLTFRGLPSGYMKSWTVFVKAYKELEDLSPSEWSATIEVDRITWIGLDRLFAGKLVTARFDISPPLRFLTGRAFFVDLSKDVLELQGTGVLMCQT